MGGRSNGELDIRKEVLPSAARTGSRVDIFVHFIKIEEQAIKQRDEKTMGEEVERAIQWPVCL